MTIKRAIDIVNFHKMCLEDGKTQPCIWSNDCNECKIKVTDENLQTAYNTLWTFAKEIMEQKEIVDWMCNEKDYKV